MEIENILKNFLVFSTLFIATSIAQSDCKLNSDDNCNSINPYGSICNDTTKFHETQRDVPIDFQLYFKYTKHYLNFSSDKISKTCRDSIDYLESSAKKFDIASIKILDASAKIGSGMLTGNLNQLGDFDECLDAVNNKFKGKYCLAEFQITPHSKFPILRDILLNPPYINEFDDIPHMIPKLSNHFWAVCVPSTCSHVDVELAVQKTFSQYIGEYISSMKLEVKEGNCQMRNENFWNNLTFGNLVAIGIFFLLLSVTCAATIYNAITSENDAKNEILMAFSITKNFKEIVSTDMSSSEIPSLNGIRFFSTIMIMLGHKTLEILFNPISNQGMINETYKGYVSVPYRAIYLYTEVFLMLSGLLTAYSVYGKIKRGQKVVIWREALARYFRFMPPVIALILFFTYILPLIGQGPLWPSVITFQTNLCKSFCWRNFLMVHNFFGFENVCLFNLHHVGTDFILFISAILLIVKLPRHSNMIFISLAIFSTFARFYITYVKELTLYVAYGTEVQKLMDSGNYLYALPPYRFTSYIIGILMGYSMRMRKSKQSLTPNFITFGWIAATFGLLLTIFITLLNHSPKYDSFNMALYSAFGPLFLCGFFAWIIYLSNEGYGNSFTKFFEWKYFKVTTNLSYGVYLIQFTIFTYNIGTRKSSIYFSLFNDMFDFNEIGLIFLAAFIMTLFVEVPFGNLKKLLFDSKKSKVIEKLKEMVDENRNIEELKEN